MSVLQNSLLNNKEMNSRNKLTNLQILQLSKMMTHENLSKLGIFQSSGEKSGEIFTCYFVNESLVTTETTYCLQTNLWPWTRINTKLLLSSLTTAGFNFITDNDQDRSNKLWKMKTKDFIFRKNLIKSNQTPTELSGTTIIAFRR